MLFSAHSTFERRELVKKTEDLHRVTSLFLLPIKRYFCVFAFSTVLSTHNIEFCFVK